MAVNVGPTGRAIGVDGSEVMIEEAWKKSRDTGLAVDFRHCDAHSLPFADFMFDACRVERTLQHVADPRQIVAEMVRVAKPGARLVAFEPDWDTIFVSGGNRATTRVLNRAHADVNTRHGCIGRDLHGLFQDAGLEAIAVVGETFTFTDLHLARYILNFDKSAEAAQAGGWLTASDYARWLDEVNAAAERGTFFAGVVGFIAVGTKRA
jgi:SAM-dependent methyltransferase